MVRRATTSNDDFAELEMVYGFNDNPCQLVLHPRLQLGVVSTLMFDWAHCLICGGTADVELGQLFAAFRTARAGCNFVELGEYVDSWTFPKRVPTTHHLFDPSRNASNLKGESFQSTASEFLTIYPVVARYLERVAMPRGELLAHVASMLAVLWLLELCHNVRRGIVTGRALLLAALKHFDLFRAAYCDDYARPKHHYQCHLGGMLILFGALLSCLTNERRHRVVKRYSLNRKNLQRWELGTLEEVTTHQLWEMSEGFLAAKRVHRSVPRRSTRDALAEMFPDVPPDDLLVSQVACSTDGEVTVGDVVVYDTPHKVGELLLLFYVGIDALAIVEEWNPLRADGAWMSYTINHEVKLVQQTILHTPLTYATANDGTTCTVFLPMSYR